MVNRILSTEVVQWLGEQVNVGALFPNGNVNQAINAIAVPIRPFSQEFNTDSQGVVLQGDQLNAYNDIMNFTHGVHVVSGVPGGGKTALAKMLCRGFEAQGKDVGSLCKHRSCCFQVEQTSQNSA
jgi:Mrp family chromosome partitioning ATPase